MGVRGSAVRPLPVDRFARLILPCQNGKGLERRLLRHCDRLQRRVRLAICRGEALGGRQTNMERPLRNPDHEARRIVIREWMALPTKQRASADQASSFVTKAQERHVLKDHGDTAARMLGWILPRVGRD